MAERNEEFVVDIPNEGEEVTVELEEAPSEELQAEQEDSEEHEVYSKKVKKRIDKLTHKVREAERQQKAAIDYAQNIQAENVQLKDRVQSLDKGYVEEYGDRIATQAESIEKDLETAIATNDTSAQVELNKKLARLAKKSALQRPSSNRLSINNDHNKRLPLNLLKFLIVPIPKPRLGRKRTNGLGATRHDLCGFWNSQKDCGGRRL